MSESVDRERSMKAVGTADGMNGPHGVDVAPPSRPLGVPPVEASLPPESDEAPAGLMGASELALRQDQVKTVLMRVLTLAAETIPGADGVGLAVQDPAHASMVGVPTMTMPRTALHSAGTVRVVAGDGFVRRVDDIQYGLDDGPCLTAARSGHIVRCGSLGSDPRWPRFGIRASRLGVHSALSLPLRSTGAVIGTMNIYSRTPHAFAGQAEQVAAVFAATATGTLLTSHLLDDVEHRLTRLRTAAPDNAVLAQAAGALRALTGLDVHDARSRLHGLSRSSGMDLSQTATAVLAAALHNRPLPATTGRDVGGRARATQDTW